jgi:uncharacterized protein YcnI
VLKERDQVRLTGVRRAGALAIGAAIGAFGIAGVAFAHVTVSPSSAAQGGFTVVTFRVPTESDTASTTKVDLTLDLSHPIAVVNVQPVTGWTAKVTQKPLPTPIKDDDGNTINSAVGEIVWSADSASAAIKPGQFQQFPLELGPLPTTSAVAFKVLQTYSDGSVVRWIDTTTPGQPEPDHPAPVLTLTPAAAAGSDTSATAPAAPPAAAAPAAGSSGTGSNSGQTWGIVGALLGLIGAVLGGASYARSRGPAESSNPPAPATKVDAV